MSSWEHVLDHLVRHRGGALVRYATLLTGDRLQAEDLVQDALMKSFGSGRSPPRRRGCGRAWCCGSTTTSRCRRSRGTSTWQRGPSSDISPTRAISSRLSSARSRTRRRPPTCTWYRGGSHDAEPGEDVARRRGRTVARRGRRRGPGVAGRAGHAAGAACAGRGCGHERPADLRLARGRPGGRRLPAGGDDEAGGGPRGTGRDRRTDRGTAAGGCGGTARSAGTAGTGSDLRDLRPGEDGAAHGNHAVVDRGGQPVGGLRPDGPQLRAHPPLSAAAGERAADVVGRRRPSRGPATVRRRPG